MGWILLATEAIGKPFEKGKWSSRHETEAVAAHVHGRDCWSPCWSRLPAFPVAFQLWLLSLLSPLPGACLAPCGHLLAFLLSPHHWSQSFGSSENLPGFCNPRERRVFLHVLMDSNFPYCCVHLPSDCQHADWRARNRFTVIHSDWLTSLHSYGSNPLLINSL